MTRPEADSSAAAANAPLVTTLAVGALAANCYVVTCPQTRTTLIIDPGAEPERILGHVATLDAPEVAIVHTHGHFDHISATEAVLGGLPEGTTISAHPADAYLYTPAARATGAAYGYTQPETAVHPNHELRDGDTIAVGTLRLRVVHTPGHTPGGISLVCEPHAVFTGDTLFQRGIGRADLPGGDEDALYESILTRLYPLDPTLVVYPGHGPTSTIGAERNENPFVQASGA